ncbi:MAG: hydrogenase maturation protease [Desulfocapsaceae bacterium]|nr:hydrogenase maturation protease [Desulfocapsaceae bacterium]
MTHVKNSTVIFGCGNAIMGDDGFGPAVIETLAARQLLPDAVSAVDAGTGVREYLFDYLLAPETRPGRIIILDAVDIPDRRPGEVFAIDVLSIPAQKISDFSLHQFPTINLLQELQEHTGMRVDILAAQVERIPEEISPGLSIAMAGAISVACEKILQLLSGSARTRGDFL